MGAPAATSSARERTRRAILEAAVGAWVRDRDATLADIAAAARTHRTTVHRHFSGRDELHAAVVEHCVEQIVLATGNAAVDEGTVVEALRRVVDGYLAVGECIRFLFGDVTVVQTPSVVELADGEGPVLALIKRGQREGVLDPLLPAAWVERSIWALVYAASEAREDASLPAHDAATVLWQTIASGVVSTRRT